MEENKYLGYQQLKLTDNQIQDLYAQQNFQGAAFNENEYLIVEDETGTIVDKFCYQNGKFRPVKFEVFSTRYQGKVKPRNIQQELAWDMLKDERSAIKLITGRFGSGKSLALITAALEAIEQRRFNKIIWVRNNVQVKDTDALGALPGSDYDKVFPYLGPMMDHVGGPDGIEFLIGSGQLEVIPLGFLRGRSLRNAIIISSEAENLTRQHIQLLMGRVDIGSNLWLDADLKQRDKVVFEKSQGIETLVDRLKGEVLFGYVHLEKSERSEVARLADKLD